MVRNRRGGKRRMADKVYRYTALEGIARKTLKEYDMSLVTGTPRAIPIDLIAEQYFGLRIEYHCLRKNGVILGETIFDDAQVPVYDTEAKCYTLIAAKRGTIILDASLLRSRTDGRLRFTLAHEVAHWIIHRELYTGSGHAAAHIRTSTDEDNMTERQADVLGTALIMPANQVKRAYYRVRGTVPYDNMTIELAKLFDVSRQAMGICLKTHSLL